MEEQKEYRYPANKISRMVSEGTIFPVVRGGLYTTDKNFPGQFLAASIYGPSYLSFDFALSYWGGLFQKLYTFTVLQLLTRKRKSSLRPSLAFLLTVMCPKRLTRWAFRL